MKKTTFIIAKMDCPSEEQMIRMKLDDMKEIRSLDFDIPNRRLVIVHTGEEQRILNCLDLLRFDTTVSDSVEVDDFTREDPSQQRRILWWVLSINLFFFLLEVSAGFLAGSMGLVADSLDMLADTIVYGMALYAAGSSVTLRKRVAGLSGYFQMILAVLGLVEVARRFFGHEALPHFQTMIIISVLALAGNALSLYILQKAKSNEAHFQASIIFTSNDIIVNLGVIIAGLMVYLTSTGYPDLIIGIIVFGVVMRGAFRILRLAGKE